MVNEWTRDDLPDADRLWEQSGARATEIEEVLNAVVDHLNRTATKPGGNVSLAYQLAEAIRERDEAIRERRRTEDDHTKMSREWWAMDARVELAERECDEWRESADKWHGEWQKLAPAVTREQVEAVVHRFVDGDGDEMHVSRVRSATNELCALFGVEDEPDPVEQKARELHKAGHPGICLPWDKTDPDMQRMFRRLAAHVLGQEADK